MMRYKPNPVEQTNLAVGQRVRLRTGSNARRWWTVRAVVEGVTVLTRQATFKPAGDLEYTVIDWRAGVRGPINVIGQGWEVDTDEQCQELAEEVRDGEWEISQRNWLSIDLEPISEGAGADGRN